jgi:hypothetical protein
MNKNYILLGVTACAVAALSFQRSQTADLGRFDRQEFMNSHLSTAGGPQGRTGAPGETNCTACHTGTAQDGTQENVFTILSGANVITDYTPGATYNVTLAMSSNPARKGFSATALDGSNNMAGTFTAQVAGGTAVGSQGGRMYATHTTTSSQSSNNVIWIWTWTAPATNVGPVTFYVASNRANNNGQDSGDFIFLSQHTIESTASLEENSTSSTFQAGYSPDDHKIVLEIDTPDKGDLYINIVDLNGRSVFTSDLGSKGQGESSTSVKLPSDLKNGLYVVNLFVNNKALSQKVMIQR